MTSPMESKLLRFFLLISRHSVTSSNKQKRKLIRALCYGLYRRKRATFLNEGAFSLTSSEQEVHVIFK